MLCLRFFLTQGLSPNKNLAVALFSLLLSYAFVRSWSISNHSDKQSPFVFGSSERAPICLTTREELRHWQYHTASKYLIYQLFNCLFVSAKFFQLIIVVVFCSSTSCSNSGEWVVEFGCAHLRVVHAQHHSEITLVQWKLSFCLTRVLKRNGLHILFLFFN